MTGLIVRVAMGLVAIKRHYDSISCTQASKFVDTFSKSKQLTEVGCFLFRERSILALNTVIKSVVGTLCCSVLLGVISNVLEGNNLLMLNCRKKYLED